MIARAASMLAAAALGAGSTTALTQFEHHTTYIQCLDAGAIDAINAEDYYFQAQLDAIHGGLPAPAAPAPLILGTCR